MMKVPFYYIENMCDIARGGYKNHVTFEKIQLQASKNFKNFPI